jgi:UTP-glucose-1-phosphate uridylyltransferase
MVNNWLWADEDELRLLCVTLSHLLRQYEVNTVNVVNEAMDYGYRQGYADAVVRISVATQERDAASFVLH